MNQHDKILSDLRQMNDEQLAAECASMLEITAGNLLRLALIVRVREERGHVLTETHIPLLRYLRKVADGVLDPAVVAKAASRPSLIDNLSKLPREQQQEWLDGKREVSGRTRKGRPHEINVPTSRSITVDVINSRVIVTGHCVVITQEELRTILRELTASAPWMCCGCGELFGNAKPVQCAKCGSHSFQKACTRAGKEVAAA